MFIYYSILLSLSLFLRINSLEANKSTNKFLYSYYKENSTVFLDHYNLVWYRSIPYLKYRYSHIFIQEFLNRFNKSAPFLYMHRMDTAMKIGYITLLILTYCCIMLIASVQFTSFIYYLVNKKIRKLEEKDRKFTMETLKKSTVFHPIKKEDWVIVKPFNEIKSDDNNTCANIDDKVHLGEERKEMDDLQNMNICKCCGRSKE